MSFTVTSVLEYLDQPTTLVTVTSTVSILSEVKLWRVHEDGERCRVLTSEPFPNFIGTVYLERDYHAPFNQEYWYQVEVVGVTTPLVAPVMPQYRTSSRSWLLSPVDPTRSVQLDGMRAPAEYAYPTNPLRSQVQGRRLASSETDSERSGEIGQLTILCNSRAKEVALRKLLQAGWVVCLCTRYPQTDLGWKWIQPGELKIINRAGYQTYDQREFVLPYEEVEAPESVLFSPWTSDDIAALGLTSDQLAARYATSEDLRFNRRTDGG